ncbi:hypothetical protein JV173_05115 [Acholeplasma equirhinis]|uniref:hypothetical protein n=1 Tax=Acholeplasma equirhinis TaxID=555393 RepID=UPI00197A7870|nr:hypothetical protein [Acholeplasma equirhinis]MBN3490893.1 hypothetical protein [Acholeplasma equirhinis]
MTELDFLILFIQTRFIYSQYEKNLNLYGIERGKEFIDKHPSFIILLQSAFQLSVISARKIHELYGKIGLSNKKWGKIIKSRNTVSHVESDKSVEYTFVEIFDILIELYNFLLNKYDLPNDEKWMILVDNYAKDFENWSSLMKVILI